MSAIAILFLQSGPAMPDLNGKIKSKYDFFSDFSSGLIVSPVAGEEYMKIKKIGKFKFCAYPYYRGNSLVRNLIFVWHVARNVFYYNKHTHINVVISPNPFLGAMVALMVRFFTGAKVIVEVNGNFEAAFKYGLKGEMNPGNMEKFKDRISKLVIPVVLKKADMVKLVYNKQLLSLSDNYEKNFRTTSFPNFVPIQNFLMAEKRDDKYILLLGYPWYLKGVDVLIKAFKIISKDFPEYKLKIVGWCPEGMDFFEDLAKDNQKIELSGPVYYDGVINLMTKCSVYVLASRTDSSPRVLREAMASKKPIIASNVDGVPDLIIDGFNGLLFENENVNELANKLRIILSDKNLAEKLAQNGYNYVQQNLSEQCYINNYKSMIEEICYDQG